jgi:hypothetical protein
VHQDEDAMKTDHSSRRGLSNRRSVKNARPVFPSQSPEVSTIFHPQESQPSNWATISRSKSESVLTTDSAFKIQLRAMLIDTSLNSVATVLANLHQSFLEAAVRCLEYARVLSKVRTTCSNLLISTSKLSLNLQRQ